MHSYTDAWTHSNQGVGLDEVLLCYIHGATQGNICFCASVPMSRNRHGESGAHAYMY